jgi:hypothetical protein
MTKPSPLHWPSVIPTLTVTLTPMPVLPPHPLVTSTSVSWPLYHADDCSEGAWWRTMSVQTQVSTHVKAVQPDPEPGFLVAIYLGYIRILQQGHEAVVDVLAPIEISPCACASRLKTCLSAANIVHQSRCS